MSTGPEKVPQFQHKAIKWWHRLSIIITTSFFPACWWRTKLTLHGRHNGQDSVSNHQPHDCLLNRLFRRRSKKISKLLFTGLCVGNSPETGEFPAQMASNAENVSILWRHHEHSHNGPYVMLQRSEHYNDVIVGAMASQITSPTMVYSIVYSDADQRKHQSSASLAFVRGIHRWPVTSLHKWPVTRKMFPFDDVIMNAGSNILVPCHGVRSWHMIYLQVHYNDVIMSAVASQMTSVSIVSWTLGSGADQRKHQSSASLAFVRGIHRDRWIPRTNGQ